MDFVPSSLANPSTVVGATLSGVTIVASTSSGMTIIGGTLSGSTFVGGSISSGTTISPAGLGAQQYIYVHRNGSAQSISASTETKVQHNTEAFDAAGVYDNATNYRMTPTIAGKYLAIASAQFDNMDAGEATECLIKKNGSTVAYQITDSGTNSANRCVVCVAIIDMNGSTDYLEHWVYHTHGSARNVPGDSTNTFFQVMRLCA